MAKITYDNKVALNENPSIADINKVNAADMNEIKTVVNGLVVNTNSNSQESSYSCDYINAILQTLNVKAIHRGKATFSVGGSSVTEHAISFGKTLEHKPCVILIPTSPGSGFSVSSQAIKTNSISKTGFTLVYKPSYTAGLTEKVYWVAIEGFEDFET